MGPQAKRHFRWQANDGQTFAGLGALRFSGDRK